MTETIDAKLIAQKLDDINVSIVMLQTFFVYAEAAKQGIIGKTKYKQYLADVIAINTEALDKLLEKAETFQKKNC